MENEKKMIFSDFVIFPTVGNNENKKNIYNKKKNLVQKTWVGLLPNCIARAGNIVL